MMIQGTNGPSFAAAGGRTSKALGKTSKQLKKILERLSTAQRINRASDDAAGLSISEQLRTQSRGFAAASNNVSDALSALRIAEGAANEVTDMLQRGRELSVQARSDTLNDEQRQMIDQEVQHIVAEVDRIAQGTQFNTQEVADGTGLASGAAVVQAGANEGETLALPSFDLTTASVGVDNVSVATAQGAADAMGAFDAALNEVNSQRSGIGAMMNRLDSAQNNLSVASINTVAAESLLRDQDMAAGLVQLTRERLLMEGGTNVFKRFNDISASHIMSLLQ